MARPLYFILALALVALHAAVGGASAAVCLCLHDGDHHHHHHHHEHDHDHRDHHAPPLIPLADEPCCCTHVEVIYTAALLGTRAPSLDPIPLPHTAPAPSRPLLILTESRVPRTRPPPDDPSRHRLAVVRATRLNL